jgi:hypothetical protein
MQRTLIGGKIHRAAVTGADDQVSGTVLVR